MKRFLPLVVASLLLVGQAHAACNDRYYYYRPSLTVVPVKQWQIYEDRDFIFSKELADIQHMVKYCGPPMNGGKYNFLAQVNIIVPADFYKLTKPLYSQPNIRLPKGVDGGKGAYIDIPKGTTRTSEQAQYTGEVSIDGKVGMVLVYLIRDGVDVLRTPEWYYRKNPYLSRSGYSYTTYK